MNNDALKREIVHLLRQEYIIFGKKACLFLQEKKIAQTAASAAAKTSAEDVLKPIVIQDTEQHLNKGGEGEAGGGRGGGVWGGGV